MARVDVEGDVGPEIVRDPVCVSFGIGHPVRSAVEVEADGHRHGPAGGIVHIHREAVAVGERDVRHQLELVRLVVRGVVPGAVRESFQSPVPHFFQAGAGVAVGGPAGNLARGLAGHQFHAVGASPHRDEFIGEVRIHGQGGAGQVIQRPVGVLVVSLQGEVDAGVQLGPIGAGGRLPAPGGLDPVVAQLPCVHRRDRHRVRNQMDVLRQGVRAGLERDVFFGRILEGQPDFGESVEGMAPLAVETRQASAGLHGKLLGRLPGVRRVQGRLQGHFPVQGTGGDAGVFPIRRHDAGVQGIARQVDAPGEFVRVVQPAFAVGPEERLPDVGIQVVGAVFPFMGRNPVVVLVITAADFEPALGRSVFPHEGGVEVPVPERRIPAEGEAVRGVVAIGLEGVVVVDVVGDA